MSYFLDFSDQVRFGIQEPDDEHYGYEPKAADGYPVGYEGTRRCEHCQRWAENEWEHAEECPHFEEQPLPF